MKRPILIPIINSFILLSLIFSFATCSDSKEDEDRGGSGDTSKWIQPKAENYEYTMTYICQISVDKVDSRSEKIEIAAFSAQECRGRTTLRYEKTLDIYLCYLTIFSNTVSGEVITLDVFDGEKKMMYENVLSLSFANNKTMGSANDILNCPQ